MDRRGSLQDRLTQGRQGAGPGGPAFPTMGVEEVRRIARKGIRDWLTGRHQAARTALDRLRGPTLQRRAKCASEIAVLMAHCDGARAANEYIADMEPEWRRLTRMRIIDVRLSSAICAEEGGGSREDPHDVVEEAQAAMAEDGGLETLMQMGIEAAWSRSVEVRRWLDDISTA